MANILKKAISVLASAAVISAVIPTALAGEKTVYYDENFDSIELGTLVNLASGTNDTYESTNAVTFECGTRKDSSYETGIKAAVGVADGTQYLDMYQTKYTGQGRAPRIYLSRTTGVTVEYDLVVKFDVKYTAATDAVILTDSSNNELKLAAPETNKWLKYTVDIKDDESHIIVEGTDGNVLSYSTSASVLKDLAKLSIVDASVVSSIAIDNLYVADEEYSLPDSVVLGAAMEKIDIAKGQTGLTYDEETGIYTILDDIIIPEVPTGTAVEWVVEQSNDGETWSLTSLVEISGTQMYINDAAGAAGYVIRLTANVTAGAESASKEFYFNIEARDPNEPIVYYDEDFSDFSGTLADLSETLSKNESYEAGYGMTFASEYRSSGNSGIVLSVKNDTSLGNYANWNISSNANGTGRVPKIMLSRTNSSSKFTRNKVIRANVKIPTASNALLIKDSNDAALQIGMPAGYENKWFKAEAVISSSDAFIVYYDMEGNPISLENSSVKLSDISLITVPVANVTDLGLDNLYIADETYSVSDATKVGAGKNTLDITTLTSSGGKYTASKDFELPEAPTGTTVSWSAMQAVKDTDNWTDSSFITFTGSTAVINPTKDIDNYDVKLVATIASGQESDTKDFAIVLPNPMTELAAAAASGYEVVNTADYSDAANTTKITYDLKSGSVLKRDLELPLTIKGSKNCSITWTSSDESHIAIAKDGKAALMTADKNQHDVTLTAVVSYKKGSVEYSAEPQTFTVKVGYEDADAEDTSLGKYSVRYDAACADNFKDIPSTATSKITLPTTGLFGSNITWSSSIPTVIKNTGEVSRATSTKTVTMTATVMKGAASENKSFEITVPGTGSGGGGGGGGSVSSTGTVSKPSTGIVASDSAVNGPSVTEPIKGEEKVNQLLEQKEQANDLFTDLSSAAWARAEINGLAKAGVINGNPDGTFAPNSNVTRAQFAKMLMGAFGLKSSAYTTSSFRDVATDAWYFEAVETAYNLGIINGVGSGIFNPDALITRQDMAVMVMRAAAVSGVNIEETNAEINFSDDADIADYAKTAVKTLQKGGIINGMSETTFVPNNNATRAQAAKILYNFLGK